MIFFAKLYLLTCFLIILFLAVHAWWMRMLGMPNGNEIPFTILLLCVSVASVRVLLACKRS